MNLTIGFVILSYICTGYTFLNLVSAFWQGSRYWRFDPTQRPPVQGSYPKDISNWEGLPNNIDDALQYSNGYTYFFKVNHSFIFSLFFHFNLSVIKCSFPFHLTLYFLTPLLQYILPSLPLVLHSQISSSSLIDITHAILYFSFSSNMALDLPQDGDYWRFNDRAFRVDSADPAFPRPTGYWWFGCPSSDSLVSIQQLFLMSDCTFTDSVHFEVQGIIIFSCYFFSI